jgi:hypothetical protein
MVDVLMTDLLPWRTAPRWLRGGTSASSGDVPGPGGSAAHSSLPGPVTTPAAHTGSGSSTFRSVEVVIYDWTIGPISWPLRYHAETRAFGKGILVEDELARAIRHESATVLAHWWGVCGATVRKWRRAFGIHRTATEGSRQLIHQTAIGALNARHKRKSGDIRLWTDEELGMKTTMAAPASFSQWFAAIAALPEQCRPGFLQRLHGFPWLIGPRRYSSRYGFLLR